MNEDGDETTWNHRFSGSDADSLVATESAFSGLISDIDPNDFEALESKPAAMMAVKDGRDLEGQVGTLSSSSSSDEQVHEHSMDHDLLSTLNQDMASSAEEPTASDDKIGSDESKMIAKKRKRKEREESETADLECRERNNASEPLLTTNESTFMESKSSPVAYNNMAELAEMSAHYHSNSSISIRLDMKAVCFGWIKHPYTKKWREKMKIFSENYDEYPAWESTICQQIKEDFQQEDGFHGFYVVKREGKTRKLNQGEKQWMNTCTEASEAQIEEKMRQRFRDGRKPEPPKKPIPSDATDATCLATTRDQPGPVQSHLFEPDSAQPSQTVVQSDESLAALKPQASESKACLRSTVSDSLLLDQWQRDIGERLASATSGPKVRAQRQATIEKILSSVQILTDEKSRESIVHLNEFFSSAPDQVTSELFDAKKDFASLCDYLHCQLEGSLEWLRSVINLKSIGTSDPILLSKPVYPEAKHGHIADTGWCEVVAFFSHNTQDNAECDIPYSEEAKVLFDQGVDRVLVGLDLTGQPSTLVCNPLSWVVLKKNPDGVVTESGNPLTNEPRTGMPPGEEFKDMEQEPGDSANAFPSSDSEGSSQPSTSSTSSHQTSASIQHTECVAPTFAVGKPELTQQAIDDQEVTADNSVQALNPITGIVEAKSTPEITETPLWAAEALIAFHIGESRHEISHADASITRSICGATNPVDLSSMSRGFFEQNPTGNHEQGCENARDGYLENKLEFFEQDVESNS